MSGPLPWRRESRLVLGLGLAAVFILGAFLPGAHGAGRKRAAPVASLKQRQAGLTARSRSALLDLYALDSRLAQARGPRRNSPAGVGVGNDSPVLPR